MAPGNQERGSKDQGRERRARREGVERREYRGQDRWWKLKCTAV